MESPGELEMVSQRYVNDFSLSIPMAMLVNAQE